MVRLDSGAECAMKDFHIKLPDCSGSGVPAGHLSSGQTALFKQANEPNRGRSHRYH